MNIDQRNYPTPERHPQANGANSSCLALPPLTPDSGTMPPPGTSVPVPSHAPPIFGFSLEDLNLEEFNTFADSLAWDNDSKNHNKAYNSFLRAASLGIKAQIAMDAVVARIHKAGGVVDPCDLEQQLHRAWEYVSNVSEGTIASAEALPKPGFSPKLLSRVACQVQIDDPEEFLRLRSIVPPSALRPSEVLEHLYKPGEKIVTFTDPKSQGQAVYVVGQSTDALLPERGPEGVLFLLPPVDGELRYLPRLGHKTRRSEENVLRWPYLLLESDDADKGQWLRLLIQLPLAIVAIYGSGRRSVHALARVDAPSKREWDVMKDRIAKVMVPLGADPKAMSAVRLSRLPQCWRGDRLQELLYLNPAADGTPILTLAERQNPSPTGGLNHAN